MTEPVLSRSKVQTPEPLDPNQFNPLIENMLTADYGELTLEQFGTAMDAVHQEATHEMEHNAQAVASGH